ACLDRLGGPLQATQGFQGGIEEEQQDEGSILIEEQLAIAGAIALGADVVDASKQRQKPLDLLQSPDGEGFGFRLACHGSTTIYRLSKWPIGTLNRLAWEWCSCFHAKPRQITKKPKLADRHEHQISCRTLLDSTVFVAVNLRAR